MRYEKPIKRRTNRLRVTLQGVVRFVAGATLALLSGTGNLASATEGTVPVWPDSTREALRHPPLPADVRNPRGGGMIGEGYALSHMSTPGGDEFWLDRIVEYGSRGKLIFDLVAVLPLPEIGADEWLHYGGVCRLNGKVDPEIIAVAKVGETEYFKKIRYAWRANISEGRFEALDVKNIDCINEAFGNYE